MRLFTATAILIALGTIATELPAEAPLTLSRTIPLPGVSGKFDHFAFDAAGNRLFAAATGAHAVLVIDLNANKVVQTISGLGKPHGLAWDTEARKLYVADGSLAELRLYNAGVDGSLSLGASIKLSDDADDMVLDAKAHLLYVGHGGSDAANPARVAVVDTATFTLKANIPVATHPEALDLDAQSHRVFANIADTAEVAVVDGATNTVAFHWKLAHAADNVPIAYDPTANAVYIGTRTPPRVLALDATTGAEQSRLPTAAGTDDLFFDRALHRVYVICGSGEVDVYAAEPHQPLRALGTVTTEAGAKTALFVPSQAMLYVGIPGVGTHPAEIRVYSTAKGNQ